MKSFIAPVLLSTLWHVTNAFQPCPIGPSLPAPTNLSSSSIFQDAIKILSGNLTAAIKSKNSTHGPIDVATSYHVQVFSLDESPPLFETFFPGTLLSNLTGIKSVTGNSIYRVGSISKLMTVYTLLAEIGDSYWSEPITKFIPELQSHVNKSKSDPINYLAWDQVTLGGLAGQVSGVTRDLVGVGLSYNQPPLTDYGFPALTPSELPACLFNITGHACNRTQFFQDIDSRQPIYAPNTVPIYSDTAFMILAYAVESITGASYASMLNRSIIQPLNLSHTSIATPPDSLGVIPVDPTTSGWNIELGDGVPMGGLYSSPSDLAKVGRSILSSTILNPNTTRAWMQPTTFTRSMLSAVGRPWEIYRSESPRTDIYTKSGDIYLYHSNLALLPEYGVGWTVMCAGNGTHTWVDGLMADIVMPALEEAAREQAENVYGGVYTADHTMNSSVVLATEKGAPGLDIKKWIHNGTDILALLASPSPKEDLSVRLYPTNLEEARVNGTEVAWRAVTESTVAFQDFGPFSACITWFTTDQDAYGMHSLGQFVFTLSGDGTKAVGLSPVTLKEELRKS